MKAQLVYDEDCGFCCVAAAAVLRADRSHRLRPLPLADTVLSEDSWHLIAADGTTFSAGAAAPQLLRLLPGGWAPAALLAAAPQITERAYRMLAQHRSEIGRRLPDALIARSRQDLAQRLSD